MTKKETATSTLRITVNIIIMINNENYLIKQYRVCEIILLVIVWALIMSIYEISNTLHQLFVLINYSLFSISSVNGLFLQLTYGTFPKPDDCGG